MYPEIGGSRHNVVLVGHLKVPNRLLGVVEIISSHDNQSSTHGVSGLKDQLGVRFAYISMERVCSPAFGACKLVLPIYPTSEAIFNIYHPC
jgi:hypothetical protein